MIKIDRYKNNIVNIYSTTGKYIKKQETGEIFTTVYDLHNKNNYEELSQDIPVILSKYDETIRLFNVRAAAKTLETDAETVIAAFNKNENINGYSIIFVDYGEEE